MSLSSFEIGEIIKKIGRKPNELEVHLFDAMWSEHCGYKHSKKLLATLPKNKGFLTDQNAGGVEIGDYTVFFKMESHNHPSAVEPYQGAATGIGGIVRDILALGARPIALLNSLKFGELNNGKSKYLLGGVVKGISDYGNSIGVPTVAGEIDFDDCYFETPLVNVMAVGIAKKDEIKTNKAEAGLLLLLIGSHTGKDGLGGASFASKELEEGEDKRICVQVGNPFMKKILIEAMLKILKLSQVKASQDCGAAGILSSTSEMVYKGNGGADLFLDKVHLREQLKPYEIMLSESQERMVVAVEENGITEVLKILDEQDIPYSIIGKTTDNKRYRLFCGNEKLADLPVEALNRAPEYELKEKTENKTFNLPEKDLEIDVKDRFYKIVSSPDFASKEWVYSQFDYTVGNRTVLKPDDSGASALWLHETGQFLGVCVSSDFRKCFFNPEEGAKRVVMDCYRKLISSGFRPLGITDCLNFANPEKPHIADEFVKTIKGLKEISKILDIPVVSGNVSFYNEFNNKEISPSLTIGMVGIAEKQEVLMKKYFQKGDFVYLLGKEMTEEASYGGSLYYKIFYGSLGGEIDCVDFNLELRLAEKIEELNKKRLLEACSNVGKGGLLGTLFKSLRYTGFKGNLINIKDIEKALFGEISGRYIISSKEGISEELKGLPFRFLGKCIGEDICFDGYKFDRNELFSLFDSSIEKQMKA